MTTTNEAKAKHQWLDASGAPVEEIESAAGIRYVDTAGNVADVLLRDDQLRLLAMFGARTLATNTVSACYGPKEGTHRPRKVDAPATDAEAVLTRFAAITATEWGAERGGGAGGVGYNLDDLCEALGSVITAAGKPFNAEKVREALESGGTYKGKALDAKAYRKEIFAVAGVSEAYATLRAAKRQATSVEEVGDDFA